MSHIGDVAKEAEESCVEDRGPNSYQRIPFSAFWLRSSVVSVLISLISDTWAIGPHDIKLIFLGGGATAVACYWVSRASHGVALLPGPGAPR
ncbi:hypothetical protein NMG60_11019832 [Bertholletia excelsa]